MNAPSPKRATPVRIVATRKVGLKPDQVMGLKIT